VAPVTDVRNADILFLYDAKLCNPNGDPDDENKPRMDDLTRRCLVSDVRLKRYLRDYWLSRAKSTSTPQALYNGGDLPAQDVWVRKGDDGDTVSASERIKALAQEFNRESGKKVDLRNLSPEFLVWVLSRLIDVRLFGATMTIKADEGESTGRSRSITGPVQFNWGYSLHPVEIVASSSITSLFAGRETGGKGEYGTIGKDWRLYYALIGFHGRVAKARAAGSGLLARDIERLEDALLNALSEEATSRSKLGQTPRLYLQIQYKDAAPALGDPRDYVTVGVVDSSLPVEKIRSIADYQLDISKLSALIGGYRERIASLRWWCHPDLRITGDRELRSLSEFVEVGNA
jgi:CRISPR-associated protein Csh2